METLLPSNIEVLQFYQHRLELGCKAIICSHLRQAAGLNSVDNSLSEQVLNEIGRYVDMSDNDQVKTKYIWCTGDMQDLDDAYTPAVDADTINPGSSHCGSVQLDVNNSSTFT